MTNGSVRRRPDRAWLQQRLGEAAEAAEQTPRITPAPSARYEPFPMTDMQQAYWLGREAGMKSRGAMQMYIEFDGPSLAVDRLERAWNALIARHDMLRAVVVGEGLQRVLPDVPRQAVPCADLSSLSEAVAARALGETREAMLAALPPLDQWPQSSLRYSLLDQSGEGRGRLHVRFDMWCFDGRSFQVLIEELAVLCGDPDARFPEVSVGFHDYVRTLSQQEAEPAFQRSLAWWRERLSTMPAPPQLPYVRSAEPDGPPRFRRLKQELSGEESRSLRDMAGRRNVSIASVMLTAYALVLSRWSGEPRFALNVPHFNRPDWHPDLTHVVGEFASFNLLEVEIEDEASFLDSARSMQRGLWSVMEHGAVSGVRQLRELGRLRGGMETGAMPVVFTTMPDRRSLDDGAFERALATFGEIGFLLTGTPQVWLDAQYFDLDGRYHLNWDAVEGLLPEGVLEAMFERFHDLLRRLAGDDAVWDDQDPITPPSAQIERRPDDGRTWRRPLDHPLLAIRSHAAAQPEQAAVVTPDGVLSRRELSRLAGAVARALKQRAVQPGEAVALHAERGAGQIAAMLGVLAAGAAAMPLDRSCPPARLRAMIERARPRLLITDSAGAFADDPPADLLDLARLLRSSTAEDGLDPPDRFAPDQPAIIIHTSGSTGLPKAAILPWGALSHVILYSNERFGLGASDRALMITASHHDMSIYDLLGPLSAGGAVVTLDPEQALSPGHWLARAVEGRATFWNSVPRLVEALASEAQGAPQAARPPLRWIVMGGDWIPLDLPRRLRAIWPDVRQVSLGGPTETVVWNIMHDIDPKAEHVGSIPYGMPIPGCVYRVVDRTGRDCPDWVAGELVCGGVGLALGYRNDPDETDRRFFVDPALGERFYRTGDRGRRRADGLIEILGRLDFQLNIGGYRADPGMIEAVLRGAPTVADAVVLARKGQGADQLAAYVVARGLTPPEAELRAHCADNLPPALVPRLWRFLERLPLTANGKVDRGALAALGMSDAGASRAPQTPLETLVADIWSDALGRKIGAIDENFFLAGGDSIAATRVLNRVEQRLGLRPSIGAFFSAPTVGGLAEHILDRLADRA